MWLRPSEVKDERGVAARAVEGDLCLGQAIVRQLPLVLSIFWIDVLFVLFTARKQRAFELLSQTRVVLHQPD